MLSRPRRRQWQVKPRLALASGACSALHGCTLHVCGSCVASGLALGKWARVAVAWRCLSGLPLTSWRTWPCVSPLFSLDVCRALGCQLLGQAGTVGPGSEDFGSAVMLFPREGPSHLLSALAGPSRGEGGGGANPCRATSTLFRDSRSCFLSSHSLGSLCHSASRSCHHSWETCLSQPVTWPCPAPPQGPWVAQTP